MGAALAMMLEAEGHDLTLLDTDPTAFERLPTTFQGRALVGSGMDEGAQRRAGAWEADAFVSVTAGDNRNVMAAQIAKHIFHVPRVASRIYDPIRNEMYRGLGLETVSPTTTGAQALKELVVKDPVPVR
jgi:trk system potassium uptake protein TrkA